MTFPSTNTETDDTFSILLIPWEEEKPIQTIEIAYPKLDAASSSDDDDPDKIITDIIINNNSSSSSSKFGNAGNLAGAFAGGKDQIIQHLYTFIDENTVQIEATPLKRMSPIHHHTTHHQQYHYKDEDLFHASGIYAYHCVNSDTNPKFANVRATRLSMSCGLLSQRFYGDVFIARLGYFQQIVTGADIGTDDANHMDSSGSEVIYMMKNRSISIDEIKYSTYVSPDLRRDNIQTLIPPPPQSRQGEEKDSNDHNINNEEKQSGGNEEMNEIIIPPWLADAAKSNYEDAAALDILASTMNKQKNNEPIIEEEEEDDESDDDENDNTILKQIAQQRKKRDMLSSQTSTSKNIVVRTPLCICCRRPTNNLCPYCEGVYFCGPECVEQGWSHKCLCQTWNVYTSRRSQLSTFPFPWHGQLTTRPCQLSDEPYETFLVKSLLVLPSADDNSSLKSNWWKTEISGWKGGESDSAKQVQIYQRLSYVQGFALGEIHHIPPERNADIINTNISKDELTNFAKLTSWSDYYQLRGLPLESPVALLCTFPLTLYYAVQEYGKAPVTIARMLNRPLRIHMVGVEKELNFLDLFKEFGYLLPNDFDVEIVFVCREDMVPQQCNDDLVRTSKGMRLELSENLTIYVQPGTFGDTLDPLFDCGSGPPDMVVGLNAGLFAYKSWRSVIEFLNENSGVVGVFTDYNEHSAMNCSTLGGGKARESLKVNPFRQPRAMPVYSMNLPQFSNGFMYVFNEQELDM